MNSAIPRPLTLDFPGITASKDGDVVLRIDGEDRTLDAHDASALIAAMRNAAALAALESGMRPASPTSEPFALVPTLVGLAYSTTAEAEIMVVCFGALSMGIRLESNYLEPLGNELLRLAKQPSAKSQRA
jgi:hypothetical protein